MMNFNGSATIRASVVDSRGRQSDTRDITINELLQLIMVELLVFGQLNTP
ncbi:phage structural protein [Streptococcus pneumoniae]|nr:phage structural protein [Streptococcus pneumoniae]